MSAIWVSTLSCRSDGDVCLDTVLAGEHTQPHGIDPGLRRLMVAATSSQACMSIDPTVRAPYALQAMVIAASLYEGLAADLWAAVTGDNQLERLRGRLFS